MNLVSSSGVINSFGMLYASETARIISKYFRGRSVIAGTNVVVCGVCKGICMEILGLWSGRAHGSLLFWMAGVIVIVFALIITKIWDGWKNSLPTPPTAEEPRRAFLQRAPHLTFLFSLHPVFLATSYSRSPLSTSSLIVFPSNCISQSLRYACNRPPLSWYHARQAIA